MGTEHIIDRYKEAKTQCFAKEIGLDPSLIKCNPENGWKIAKYIENVPFLTREEQRHYYAYIAITAYFYFSWAVYMESSGHDIGEFSYLWFNYALYYSAKANDLYDDTINEGKIR